MAVHSWWSFASRFEWLTANARQRVFEMPLSPLTACPPHSNEALAKWRISHSLPWSEPWWCEWVWGQGYVWKWVEVCVVVLHKCHTQHWHSEGVLISQWAAHHLPDTQLQRSGCEFILSMWKWSERIPAAPWNCAPEYRHSEEWGSHHCPMSGWWEWLWVGTLR